MAESSPMGVGSDFTLELEFANVGKTTLMKLENIFAEGPELDALKAQIRVEGTSST